MRARAAERFVWTAFLAGGAALWWLQTRPSKSLVLLGAVLAVLGGALALAELRGRAWTTFLARLAERPGAAYLFVAWLGLILGRSILTPGHLFYGDGMPHSGLTWLLWKGLAEGEIPFWTNYWYSGFPYLEFYPPLYHWTAAVAAAAAGDLMTGQKLVLAGTMALSAVAMFALVRALAREARVGGALVAALAYAGAPWHFYHVLMLNRFPVAWVWALLPLPFLVFERSERRPALAAALAGLAITAIILAHTGYAIFTVGLFTLYVFARMAGAERPERLRMFGVLAGAGAVAGLTSAFYLVPMVLEQGLVFDMPKIGRARFFFDQPSLPVFLLWSRGPRGHAGYVGLTILALAAAGGFAAVRAGVRAAAAWVGLAAVALFLALGHGLPGYGLVPLVYTMFYAGRYQEFVSFALAVLVGIGFEPLVRALAARTGALRDAAQGSGRPYALVVAATAGLVLADVGMSSFFRHPRAAWDGRKDAAYAALAEEAGRREGRDAFFRALDLTSPTSITNSTLAGNTILPILAGVASPYGDVPWASPNSFPYLSQTIIELSEAYAERGDLGPHGHDLARLLNVAYLVTGPARLPGPHGEPWPRKPREGADALTAVPTVSPLIASRRVEAVGDRWAPDPAAHWWEYYTTDLDALRARGPDEMARMAAYMGMTVEEMGETPWRTERPMGEMAAYMGIGPGGIRAERLLTRNETDLAAGLDAEAAPELRVRGSRMTSTRIEIDYDLDGPAVARIARSYHPHMGVRVDGEPVPFAESADAMVLARLPGGSHTVAVEANLSPLRATTAVVSGGALLVLAALPALRRRRLSR